MAIAHEMIPEFKGESVTDRGYLTAEREKWLFDVLLAHRNSSDRKLRRQAEKAREELIVSHLPLARKLARGNKGYSEDDYVHVRVGIERHDLESECHVAVIKAVDTFDPSRGARLSVHVRGKARELMNLYIQRNFSTVQLPRGDNTTKLFYGAVRIRDEIERENPGITMDGVYQAIAERFNVPASHVPLFFAGRAKVESNRIAGRVGETDGDEIGDFLVDANAVCPSAAAETNERVAKQKRMLELAISRLTEREQMIIRERHMAEEGVFLSTLSAKLGVSRERVRQIEAEAMGKMRIELAGMARGEDGFRRDMLAA